MSIPNLASAPASYQIYFTVENWCPNAIGKRFAVIARRAIRRKYAPAGAATILGKPPESAAIKEEATYGVKY